MSGKSRSSSNDSDGAPRSAASKRGITSSDRLLRELVAGGDVRISKVTIAHGDLKVSVVTDYAVSQPLIFGRPNADVRTEVVPNTRIDVDESEGGVVELSDHNTVADLLRALNRIKASTRDIIAILQGIKAAGALHGELIIQ